MSNEQSRVTPHLNIPLTQAIGLTLRTFERYAKIIHRTRWQGVDVAQKPEMATHEILDYTLRANLGRIEDLEYYRGAIQPSIPWADDHFLERVGGLPLNPGEQWKHWPYAHSAANFLEGGIFSHTYMERYWPRKAGEGWRWADWTCNHGIREEYGDLDDLVEDLANEPFTRQAYLPVWFPEDTGAHNKTRKPCTLGYWFVLDDHWNLNVTYYIRSCDLLRHFRDDIYLTVRLLLWVLEQCRKKAKPTLKPVWISTIRPGTFTMHIGSLHCFRNDWETLLNP